MFMKRMCHVNKGLYFLTYENHSPKTISQQRLDYGLFKKSPKIIIARKGIRNLFLNKINNLKTNCHIKSKSFLWTKLLEKLLPAKYPIFATVAWPWKHSWHVFIQVRYHSQPLEETWSPWTNPIITNSPNQIKICTCVPRTARNYLQIVDQGLVLQ